MNRGGHAREAASNDGYVKRIVQVLHQLLGRILISRARRVIRKVDEVCPNVDRSG